MQLSQQKLGTPSCEQVLGINRPIRDRSLSPAELPWGTLPRKKVLSRLNNKYSRDSSLGTSNTRKLVGNANLRPIESE
jgi:hypothetical protein